MRNMWSSDRRVLVVAAISWLLTAIAANVSYAQRVETDSARAVRHDKEAASLAKQSHGMAKPVKSPQIGPARAP